jgi:hypothetical protein
MAVFDSAANSTSRIVNLDVDPSSMRMSDNGCLCSHSGIAEYRLPIANCRYPNTRGALSRLDVPLSRPSLTLCSSRATRC